MGRRYFRFSLPQQGMPWGQIHFISSNLPQRLSVSAVMSARCNMLHQASICAVFSREKSSTPFSFVLTRCYWVRVSAWSANKRLRFPCSSCQISNSPAQMSSLSLPHFCFTLCRASHFRQLSWIFSREGDLETQLEFIEIRSPRLLFEKKFPLCRWTYQIQ